MLQFSHYLINLLTLPSMLLTWLTLLCALLHNGHPTSLSTTIQPFPQNSSVTWGGHVYMCTVHVHMFEWEGGRVE